MTLLKKVIYAAALALMAGAASSCSHIDDDRIPAVAVRVPFNTIGEWTIYGVSGAGSYRYFIKSQREPDGYPYTAMSYTGFGGILLIADVHGNPVAYDLSCPVECKADVRIKVIPDELKAECPVCHSVYDIVTNYGHPLSGEAARHGYGLRKYFVGPGYNGEYMIIAR